jgi:hypothetical protein
VEAPQGAAGGQARVNAADVLLAPADRARRDLLRLAARTALGRRCLRDRSPRLALLAAGSVAAALALATSVPLWALLIGPLLLGVPHVIADVRYLVLDRPGGLSDRQARAILVPLAAGAVLSLALPSAIFGPGLLAVAGAVAFAPAPLTVRGIALVLVAAASILPVLRPDLAQLGLAHAHNAVAVALWLGLSTGRPSYRRAAAALMFAGGVAVGAGAFDALPSWVPPAEGFDAVTVGASLELPGLGPSRSLLLFAYAQALHYAIWLRLIPGERAAAESPLSFRRAVDGLRAMLGSRGFAIAVALAVAVPLAGGLAPVAVRRLYLDLAGVHAWLELAVAAHLLLARR